MEICGPTGRDCIEGNSAKSFNCSTTCQGIYADVQWLEKKTEEDAEDEAGEIIERKIKGDVGEELVKVYKQLADLKTEMKLMKSQEKGEELDKEKYKMLIAEYRKFKTKNVRHFRFNSEGNSSAFGKFLILSILTICH